MDYETEIRRTQPDFVVYVPKVEDYEEIARQYRGAKDAGAKPVVADSGNEHFLVERLPQGGLCAIWTQSSFEGAADQRVVFARSLDEGEHWTDPVTIAGRDLPAGSRMASWGFPLVSRAGRIYVIYSRHMGIDEVGTHTTGRMACIYSDDCGQTWSPETFLTMPRSIWDNPDPAVPPNWIVWQKPLRLSTGKHFTGFTRWLSPKAYRHSGRPEWWADAAVVEFMRFENVDEHPEPAELAITFLARDGAALRTGLAGYPDIPDIQEPSWVELPDHRLFCVMRATTGSPFYAVSSDWGETWTAPEPLRRYDDGPILPHPCSPCPLYALDAEHYFFLYHNHDGHFLEYTPSDTGGHRRPICLAHAEFRPGARQPVWFSEPWYFMDNGGVAIVRSDMAMYASTTADESGVVLWYPERKFFLLGRRINLAAVRELKVRRPA